MTLKADEFENNFHLSKFERNDSKNKNESKIVKQSDRGVMDEEDWSKLTIKERIRIMKLDTYKSPSCVSDSSRSNSNVQNEDESNKDDLNQDEANQEDKVSTISVKERVQAIDFDKDYSINSSFDQTQKTPKKLNNSNSRCPTKSLPKTSTMTERVSEKLKPSNSTNLDKKIESEGYNTCSNQINKIMDSKKIQSSEATSPCATPCPNGLRKNELIHKEEAESASPVYSSNLSSHLGSSTRHRIMIRRFNTKLATTTLTSSCLKIAEERRDANVAMNEVEDELTQSRISSSQSNLSTHATKIATSPTNSSIKRENVNQNSSGQRFISFSPARRRALFQTAKTASSSFKQNQQPQQLSPVKSEDNKKDKRSKSVNSIVPRPTNNKRRLTMNQKLQNIKKFNNKDIQIPLEYNQILGNTNEIDRKNIEKNTENIYCVKKNNNFLSSGSICNIETNSTTKISQSTIKYANGTGGLVNPTQLNHTINQYSLNHGHSKKNNPPMIRAERNSNVNSSHSYPNTYNAHEGCVPFHVDTSLINKSGETVSRVNDEDMIVEGPLFDADDSIHHYEPFMQCPSINNNNFHCHAFSSMHIPVSNQSHGKTQIAVYNGSEKVNSPSSPLPPPVLIRSSQRDIIIQTMQSSTTPHENMYYFAMNDESRGSDESPSSIPHKVEKTQKYTPCLAYNTVIPNGQITSDDTRSPNQDKSFDNYVQTSLRELVETRIPQALSKDTADTERMSNVTTDTMSGRNDFRDRLKKGIWCKTDIRKSADSSHIHESDYGERKYNQESESEIRDNSKYEESPETCTAHIFNIIDGMCMHFTRKSKSQRNCSNNMKKGKKSKLMQLSPIISDNENDIKQTHSSGPSPRSLHDFEYLNQRKDRIGIGIASRKEGIMLSSRDLNARFYDVKGVGQSGSRSKEEFLEIQ